MRLLAISGSLRSTSSNTALLRALAALAPPEVSIELFEGLGDLPFFDPGLDLDPLDYRAPEPVLKLRDRIKAAEGLIFCTPEYAFGIPGVLKNALDWVVSMGVIEGKPVVALAASPSNTGGDKAHQGLLWVLTALNAQILQEASFPLPRIRQRLNAAGEIVDPATDRVLRTALEALIDAVEARRESP
ncbi:MAG: NAD(P)H-dependent oxidoreductase [Holophagaceae bacterium]|nr:NAD(P)H-dependent oxidoreductase [Holophagaceae bacterium]